MLERVGHLWEEGRISLVELYGAGRAAEVATELLEPLPRTRQAGDARVAIAVLEDQHVLGKRLVAAHLRAGGVALLDLGVGLSAPVLVAQALEARVDVLLVSTLMLRGALKVHDVVRRLRDAGSAMRVVVGGAPFRLDPELYLEVGADACGRSAGDALALVHRLGHLLQHGERHLHRDLPVVLGEHEAPAASRGAHRQAHPTVALRGRPVAHGDAVQPAQDGRLAPAGRLEGGQRLAAAGHDAGRARREQVRRRPDGRGRGQRQDQRRDPRREGVVMGD